METGIVDKLEVNKFSFFATVHVNVAASALTLLAGLQKRSVHILVVDIAPLRSESPPQKRSGMARVLKESHSFTCTPTRSSAIGTSHIPAFAFPAIAGTHLPIPEGWKAESAWVDG